MSFDCILIGQDNLLIQCGALLLEKKHQIRYVVSLTKSIHSWCEKNNIPYFISLNEIPSYGENTVDYLFSIVNGKILTQEDLKLARFLAINYHDSPLPKYAGVNATTWAIINGEKNHGITWHVVDDGIDEGDIVYQSKFSINDNDTSLTLNLRCFEEAIKGFSEIIRMIETSSLIMQKQYKEERSYYGIKHVLPNLGFIDWETASASQLDALSRALNFGNYSNNVGTLKLYLNNSYVIVSNLEISNIFSSSNESGVILDIQEEGVLVSTTSRPILIKTLITPNGQALTTSVFVERYKLHVGFQFPFLGEPLIEQSRRLYSKALRDEQFWIIQLSSIIEHGVFSDRFFKKHSGYQELPAIAIENLSQIEEGDLLSYLLTAVLIYLYRLNDYINTTVFLYQKQPKNESVCYAELFADFLPINIDIKSDFSLEKILSIVKETLNFSLKHGIYLSDVFVRHPILASSGQEKTITVGLTDRYNLPPNSMIHFEIDRHTKKLYIYHQVDCDYLGGVLVPLVSNMSSHIKNITRYMLTAPKKLVHQFSFLTDDEQKKILRCSIGEHIPLPSNSINDLFEYQVKQSPAKLAIFNQNASTTYYQLWQMSEKTSAFIRSLRLPSQTLIGLYLPPTIELFALIIGIIKADAVCVPLSHEDINTDIEKLMVDKKFSCFFSTKIYLEELTALFKGSGFPKIHDVEEALIFNDKIINEKGLFLNSLYLESKQTFNIMISEKKISKEIKWMERNVINYCYWFSNVIGFTNRSIIEFSSHLAFPEALSPLLTGGTIFLPYNDETLSSEIRLSYLKEHKITHTRLTSQKWEAFLQYPSEISQLTDLRYLVLTEDVSHMHKVNTWLSYCPKSQFIVV